MNPTPAQLLACEIVASFRSAMAQAGMDWDHQASLIIEARIAREIQQLADEQAEQTDAQAFGDDLEVAAQGTEQCDCYSLGADLIVTAHPLFPDQPTHGSN